MKFCTKCGTQLHDDDIFCTKCGYKAPQFEPQTKIANPLNNNEINNINSESANTTNNSKTLIFKKIFSTHKIVITITAVILCVVIIGIVSPFSDAASIEKNINKLLKNDLNTSIEIIKLYHNEEKHGCFVEFQTRSYTDKAAINLNTEIIEYESEFDYWTAKAEELRNQKPINQTELHKYNQKIINSFYAEWSFSITVFEANGRPKDSDWERIK